MSEILYHVEQPQPIPNGRQSVQSLVRDDLAAREQVGRHRYGTSLQPFNGRDALVDLYEELLDAVCYLKQYMVEQETNEALRQPQLADYVNLRQHLIHKHAMGVHDAAVLAKTEVIQAHLNAHRSEQDHDYHPWGDPA